MKRWNWSFIAFYFISQILLLITNWPFITNRWLTNQTGSVSTYVHDGHVDYYTYLTFIRESKEGAWQVLPMFTSEGGKPSSIYVFYIAVGKFAKIFNVSPVGAYHISRILSVELFIIAIYLLVQELAGRRLAIWAALIGLYSTTPRVAFGSTLWNSPYALNWWYNLDPLFRMDYVAHHQFSVALTFVALFFFLRYQKNYSIRVLITAGCASFVSALVFPTPALILFVALPVTTGIVWVKSHERSISDLIRNMVPVAALWVPVVVAALIIRSETLKGFPWSQWTSWDVVHWNRYPNFEQDFIAAGGPILAVSLPAIILFLIKSGSWTNTLLAVWAILPYILFPFCDFTGLAKIRLGFISNWLPLGILAVHTVNSIAKIASQKIIRLGIAGVFFLLFILLSYQTTRLYYWEKLASYRYNGPEMFVGWDRWQAIGELARRGERHRVILSDGTLGNIIPAFAPMVSYCCHAVHTYNVYEKMGQVGRFFSGSMSKQEAAAFIKNGFIRYIIADDRTIEQYRLPISQWYTSANVVVYEVNEN